jgi:stress response protein YsnF
MAESRIPVVEEQLAVQIRQRETGRVRVDLTAREENVPLEADLVSDEVVVRRVPADRFVTGPVPDRQEGDTLVISVVEEVLVVEKRLKVVEEIHITRHRRTRHLRRTASRRRQEARIERS